MTIDEAIERLDFLEIHLRNTGHTRSPIAVNLGIEALKQWKLYRAGYVPSQDPLLPGETN